MALSYKQFKFLELASKGHKFQVGSNKKGFTVDSITNYNPTLYATITMRSLLKRELIAVNYNGISLTEKGETEYAIERSRRKVSNE
jgi:hypothetical protein